MDISRVISDVGSMTVKLPNRVEPHKHDSASVSGSESVTSDKLGAPQEQVAKIVRSAEELTKQKTSTETAPKETPQPVKGLKVDEYA
jgi:hypothetical protein